MRVPRYSRPTETDTKYQAGTGIELDAIPLRVLDRAVCRAVERRHSDNTLIEPTDP